MNGRHSSSPLLALALAACAQSAAPVGSPGAGAPLDWLTRAVAAVRVSDDTDDVRDCEFVAMLPVPGGWDGELEAMSQAETNALNEMRRAAAQAGGNFVLLYPGEEPSGEAYLCTE
jgi:hypothetical protein